MQDTFVGLVESSIPQLRRYANTLCRNPDAANDLLQDTLVRTLAARVQFQEGTNFMAWASTILRHRFLDQRRNARESSQPIEDVIDAYRVTLPRQESAVEFAEFARAMSRLGPAHQEILMLVGVDGLSYEQTAAKLSLPIGTVRSRLFRARAELRSAMDR